MPTQIQQVSVKGLFTKDNTVLLVNDPKGKWELPGGRIDFGETPQAALKRELAEELGWHDVSVNDPIDTWTFTTAKDGVDYQFVVIVFDCVSPDQEITPCDEYTEVRWVPVKEVGSLNIRQGYVDTINKYFKVNSYLQNCYMAHPLQILSVIAVVRRGTKYLLVQRSLDDDIFPGHWQNPGGKVELGETIEEALRREIKEETGIAIDGEVELTFVQSYSWQKSQDEPVRVGLIFLVALDGKRPEVKLSPELADYGWFSLAEATKLNTIGIDSPTGTLTQLKLADKIQPPKQAGLVAMAKQQPVPPIKVVFRHQDKIMMLRLNEDDRTVYDLPGGRMEYGEGIFETLKREVREEIGVEIDFKTEPKLLRVKDYLHAKDGVHRLLVDFVYETPDLIVKKAGQGEPNTETVWLTREEVSQLEINADYKKMLLSAFEV